MFRCVWTGLLSFEINRNQSNRQDHRTHSGNPGRARIPKSEALITGALTRGVGARSAMIRRLRLHILSKKPAVFNPVQARPARFPGHRSTCLIPFRHARSSPPRSPANQSRHVCQRQKTFSTGLTAGLAATATKSLFNMPGSISPSSISHDVREDARDMARSQGGRAVKSCMPIQMLENVMTRILADSVSLAGGFPMPTAIAPHDTARDVAEAPPYDNVISQASSFRQTPAGYASPRHPS